MRKTVEISSKLTSAGGVGETVARIMEDAAWLGERLSAAIVEGPDNVVLTSEPLESILAELESLAAERGSVIYNIHFCEAGIGIQWWEESRVTAGEATREDGEPLKDFMHRRREVSRYRMEQGEITYCYYPDLRACLEGELERLKRLAEKLEI